MIELGEHLQMNPQTLRNWITAGKLEYVKVGRARHVTRRAAVALAGGTGWEMPELLTVTQVAELLKVCEMTIRNWIDAGTCRATDTRRSSANWWRSCARTTSGWSGQAGCLTRSAPAIGHRCSGSAGLDSKACTVASRIRAYGRDR